MWKKSIKSGSHKKAFHFLWLGKDKQRPNMQGSRNLWPFLRVGKLLCKQLYISKLCVYKITLYIPIGLCVCLYNIYISIEVKYIPTPVQRKAWIYRKYVLQKSTFLTKSSCEPFFNWSWHYELMKDLAFRKYVAREHEFAFYECQTYFLLIQIRYSIPLTYIILKNIDYGPSLLKIAILVFVFFN